MRRVGIFILLALFCASSVMSCSWAGRTTGKVVNKVEKGANDFEEGYETERKK